MADFLHGAGAFCLTVLPAAAIMFTLRKLVRIPDELFRKILHFILLGAYIPVLYGFSCWWHAALFIGIVIVLAYPILRLVGHSAKASAFVNERKQGEFKSSMVLALGLMILCITITWGLMDDKLLGLSSIYAWGVGDAFAALVGKRYGRHKLRLHGVDHRKSVEGSAAMLATSAVAVFIVLMLRGGLSVPGCALVALTGAAVATLVEMYTRGGYDTITCPAATMLVMLPLTKLLGGAL